MTNNMPERIIAGYGFHGDEWCLPESANVLRLEDTTEYIRADVAAAQLAERDARIAELEAVQAWVSVDERLPDDEDNGVIAWTNNASEYSSYNFDLAFYHKNFGWLMATEWEHGDPTVTHWMPLPPPPVTDETHHR